MLINMGLTQQNVSRNISNTRESITPNTEKRVKNSVQRSIFDEIRGVWIADETLSRMFDLSSKCSQMETKTKK